MKLQMNSYPPADLATCAGAFHILWNLDAVEVELAWSDVEWIEHGFANTLFRGLRNLGITYQNSAADGEVKRITDYYAVNEAVQPPLHQVQADVKQFAIPNAPLPDPLANPE